MNVEQLAKNAIDKIKTTWGLPQSGFIAGGSIANLIWEEVSGNKAVINDIDVFLFDGILENLVQDKSQTLYEHSTKEDIWYEDYNGIAFMTKEKDFYCITESTKDGMFNYIKYQSNSSEPRILIDSFDINCTAVGYSIDDDKFYWTKEFKKFLETGELRITNVKTPSHTVLRIIKKEDELNATLTEFELNILQYALSDNVHLSPYKVRFQERYLDVFVKYIDRLSEFFYIQKDVECINWLKNSKRKDVKLWKLISSNQSVFNDKNLSELKADNYLFYIRNVYVNKNKNLNLIWKHLHYFYETVDYVDKEVDEEDIKLLSRFVYNAPNAISNLKGLKLSEQVNLVKKLLEVYKDDPIIAISLLEKSKLEKDIELDEQTKLLLELSVRKEIVNDTRGKVNKILIAEEEIKEEVVIDKLLVVIDKLFTI
jgi:hypothetical protein